MIEIYELQIRDYRGVLRSCNNLIKTGKYLVEKNEYNNNLCNQCGEFIPYDMSSHGIHGKKYCEGCARFICSMCGEVITEYDHGICKECKAKHEITVCPACEKQHSIHKTCMCEIIKGYSYKPEPLFRSLQRQSNKVVHFGMEVELDWSYSKGFDKTALAEDLQNMSEGLMYAKEDSSIDGFEMVFHPMTKAFIEQSKVVKNVIKRALIMNPSQQNAGFHIHIGKKHISALGLYSIIKEFQNPKTQVELLRLSKRSMGSFNEWAKIPEKYPASEAKRKKGTSKHATMAILEDTIEFRLFNGIKQWEEVLENIAVVETIINWAKRHRDTPLHKHLKQIRSK